MAVAVAGPLVILALALAAVYNPLVLGLEQDRTAVAAITGYPSAEVHRVTTAILSDLILGPPGFGVSVGGQPVLGTAERSHMLDVRDVLLRFVAIVLVAVLVLLAAGAAGWRSAWFWRALGLGSGLLAGLVIVVGGLFALFFDQAFLAFHEVFFPQGDFTFDPRTQRLVQLFPEQFWAETTVAMALVALVLASIVSVASIRRARQLERPARVVAGAMREPAG